MGDININISPNRSDSRTDEYLSLAASHGLLPAHEQPTRDENCLDHVMLKTNNTSTVFVLDTCITDHSPTLLCIDLKLKQTKTRNIVKRLDIQSAIIDVKNTDFTPILSSNDANIAAENLVTILSDIVRSNARDVKISHRNRIIKPWITPGLLKCIRNRDNMHIESEKDKKNMVKRITYTRYRNFCNELLKKLKRVYEQNEFEKAKGDPKATWDVIKNVAQLNQQKSAPDELLNISEDPTSSINEVNDFFVNIGKNLAVSIMRKHNHSNVSSPQIPLPQTNNSQDPNLTGSSMALLDVDEREIETIIMGLRNDCAIGWDGISANFLKEIRTFILPALTHVINLCFSNGKFPRVFKRALVHPIFKSGDRGSVTNYRPISVLTTISKVIEKALNTRLVNFLNTNKILAQNQFGFRRGCSTEDAIMDLTEHISRTLDHGNKCIGLFLDLSKAFDTVSVPILVDRLQSIGIRGIVLDIFRNYLTERSQSVKIGSLVSNEQIVSYGVPQGSVLGPTLFLIYINNLCTLTLPHTRIVSYADDTALLIDGPNWEQTKGYAEDAFRIVMNWLSGNLLTLNLDKTSFVTFSLSQKSQPQPETYTIQAHCCDSANAYCDCLRIKRTFSVKYLGVQVDCLLSWKKHIDELVPRIRKLIYVFKKLRTVADLKTLKTVYFALAQSLLGYCISVWGGTFAVSMLRIERAQRAVLKVMCRKPFRYPTALLFKECEVLTVRQLFVLQITLRKHATIPQSLRLREGKRKRTRLCSTERHRTALAQRHYWILGSRVYDKVNAALNICLLTKHQCKTSVTAWLNGLTYEESERLIQLVS